MAKRKYKLSELILRGCKLSPKKCSGSYVRREGGQQYSCAIGAAYLAAQKLRPEEVAGLGYEAAVRRLMGIAPPDSYDTSDFLDPRVGRRATRIFSWVMQRNDSGKWSRERIAAQLAAWGY